jgi:hypothetical protein
LAIQKLQLSLGIFTAATFWKRQPYKSTHRAWNADRHISYIPIDVEQGDFLNLKIHTGFVVWQRPLAINTSSPSKVPDLMRLLSCASQTTTPNQRSPCANPNASSNFFIRVVEKFCVSKFQTQDLRSANGMVRWRDRTSSWRYAGEGNRIRAARQRSPRLPGGVAPV